MNPTLVIPKKNLTKDWSAYITANDPQSNPQFDTQACVAFSATHTIEIQLNWLIAHALLPQDTLNWCRENGYLNQEGKFELSERYAAIQAGTTVFGSNLFVCWDSILKFGCVPLADMPFDNTMNWKSFYTDVPVVTVNKGLEFLKRFRIEYQCIFQNIKQILDPILFTEWLTESPLQLNIPWPPHHAVTMYGITPENAYEIYDQYVPYRYMVAHDYQINDIFRCNVTPMQTVTLTRTNDDGKETRGTLTTDAFSCVTLERPWIDNHINISSIPIGTYQCAWAFMRTLNEWHYQVVNVPNRTGIFFHEMNYVSQVEGCIGIGASFADINQDGELDATNSRATLTQFETLMDHKPFLLTIK